MSNDRCTVKPQLPASNTVTPGTPESVANAAICVGVLEFIVTVVVCCAAAVAVGLHSLYVGVPKALLVFTD